MSSRTFTLQSASFFVSRSLYLYRDISPCDLDHLWNDSNGGRVFGCISQSSTHLFVFFLSFSLYFSVFFFECINFWLFLSFSIFFCMTLFWVSRWPFCSLSLSLSFSFSVSLSDYTNTFTRYVKSMVRENDMPQVIWLLMNNMFWKLKKTKCYIRML